MMQPIVQTREKLITGSPEISEYFFAGLKLGGALIELSEIFSK